MPQSELSVYFPNAKQLAIKFGNEPSETLNFQSPITQKDLDDLRWYIEVYAVEYTGEPDDEEAKRVEAKLSRLGEALFNAVFASAEAQALFHAFQQQATDKLLTIHADTAEILALPWELLREPQHGFLSQQQPPVSIRRFCVQNQTSAFSIQAKPKLRLLFIVSRPSDEDFLNPRLDPQAVMDALAENNISQIEVEFLRPATLQKLEQRLGNIDLPAVDIIHFDGHGVYDDTEQQGYLLFENPRGKEHFVSATQLNEILASHKTALVVLSACQSATVGNEPFGSVAAGLTDKSVPTVLAMVYSVLVTTTRQLFAAFYQKLAQGNGIGAALDSARQSMRNQNQRGKRRRGEGEFELTLQDWFVPALYQASNDNTLLSQPDLTGFKNLSGLKRSDLPALQTAGFFGRSVELWKIERWFVQGVERITITGFGGQGKTYCAIEAAQWFLRTELFDAVCFVDFSRYQGLDALRYAMNALGVLLDTTLLDENAVPPLLQTRTLLWVWDNLESLAAETLDELLTIAAQWSAHCRFLFTTRQHRFTQPDYADSPQHRYLDLAGLAETDALAYFNRLWQTAPPPELTFPARYELIALFGKIAFHPLSIGLLAQQLKTRMIAELGERLEALLLCEPEGSEDKSLLASLKLSLERLPPEQRELVKRFGVFQGGAMELAILDITEISENEWEILLPVLKSSGLIQTDILFSVTDDYKNKPAIYLRFHPFLAPALWQELNNTQQAQLLALYTQRYYQLSDYLYSEDSKAPHAVRNIALPELPNLLFAVNNAVQTGETFAVFFTNNVCRFLDYFGFQQNKATLTNATQQLSSDSDSQNWLSRQRNQGEQLFDEGLFHQAESIFQEIFQQLDKSRKYECCITLNWIARCFKQQGKITDAINCYQCSLDITQQLESSTQIQQLTATLHSDLGDVFRDDGNYGQSQVHYEQALTVIRKSGDIRSEVIVQTQLGTLAMVQGDLHKAEQLYHAALKIFPLLSEPQSKATVWHQLGYLYNEAKDWKLAEEAYRESAKINETLGNLTDASKTWLQLALLTEAQGKHDVAESWYRKAINSFKTVDDKHGQALGLRNLADLLRNQLSRLNEAHKLAEEALAISKDLDEASVEIWKTYGVLAEISGNQQNSEQAKTYRQLSHDSYLRFKGMFCQMKQHLQLIRGIVSAVYYPEQQSELKNTLSQFPESSQNLAKTIQQILDGERDELVLVDWLNYGEAAIIHLILKGIENPESLETLFNA